MQTAEIRRRWLDFFERKGHTVVPSASLVSDDPSLMFTVAGMVPFVPYLSGLVPAPYPRATSVQKCIRTNDIEEVGKTPRHGTFFQMCGNFSFGDYFKEGAIQFAWELLTTSEADGGLGFDADDLWVTVYEDDDEAIALWKQHSTLPEERIQRLGKDTNYWSTGQPGPAGPCSEIFFDRGPEYGIDGGPATDDDRYVEIWNLVFMQYQVADVKSKTDFTILGELPKKNIDTGLGLERVAFLKQGVDNMYEIDEVRPVLDRAAELAGKTYGADHTDDVRLRVIADHVRSGLMLIADGVTPSNEGRGYILRRLLRRVILSMRLLGVEGPVFDQLFPVSRDAMKGSYPAVERDFDFISRAAYAEEKTFLRTLASGIEILDGAIDAAKSGTRAVTGDTAFLLHDTKGFPIELTLEIAEEAGVTVDEGVFKTLMQEQRERAKADAKAKKGQRADLSIYKELRGQGETLFTGYDELTHESRVLGIVVDGKPVPAASEGQVAEVVLAETSLFAESGGQDADQGLIIGDGFEAEVLDVQKPVPGLIVHTVRVEVGTISVDARAETRVDADYRRGATQAHSGTHIVHAALRQVLGSNAHQAGSYNKAGYLRLDFTHGEALSPETKSEIEEISNRAIRSDYEVVTREMPLDEAKALGAMALFGEKYGERVRMVDIGGPWSRELCAGTHVSSSAEVGMINLISESSVGSTNRRIESLVGLEAFQSFAAERAIVHELSAGLRTPRGELVQRVQDLGAQLKAAEKKIAQLEAAKLAERVPELLAGAEMLGSVRAVLGSLGTVGSADDVRGLVLQLRDRLADEAGVVVLAGDAGGKPVVIAATTAGARDAGIRAGDLAKLGAQVLGGGGGGKPDLAQGGGADVSKIDDALAEIRRSIGA
ncbi:alanine--tRNA ligase [Leucobacter sp. OLJS4]|uniref:alanine--tRNA ligase n=1 Tax=unclassified Leucobacter TaxID=2621730 RepID=UPI000C18261B|nr:MULTISPECIES: alanine--tRNA ligase [unclassified Leucobacter]PII81617.1 alanine--tRNA ligase [Leucobacter sp. OLCALW19]PII86288.1 alanine--tRNA ligase [Leucobacter sp. OLTLW20]PII90183.1 alanine--tRNA ligase [Leucobacter sp. OLAS13]PII97216.1 alanine--tRNA ligase [Leucobacter sp. OLDS2]PIJ01528.1 alanine--tRNA ligase [Leucobacter sp. OLCS4]